MKAFCPILIVLTLGLSSCADDNLIPTENELYYNCHLEQGWPTANILEHITGKWRWIYKKCPGIEAGQDYLEYKGQIVEFKDDFTLEIVYDDNTSELGTYSVSTNGNHYGFNTSPEIPFLQGRIFFCFDEMEANRELVNQCNNYLRKQPY